MKESNFKIKILADSISNDVRLTSIELEYPRFIHAEMLTHRVFSRNSSSSRAIPVEKILNSVEEDPVVPIHWGENKSGMQADKEIKDISLAYATWLSARDSAIFHAESLRKQGVHKQVANRILEPFQHIRVLITATEWDNFFKLRNSRDAQPEIQFLAQKILSWINGSKPHVLTEGQWHTPYVGSGYCNKEYVSGKGPFSWLEVSAARCARISYHQNDTGKISIPETDSILARKLSRQRHLSPFEHQATPIPRYIEKYPNWPKGITHVDRWGKFWSGNFNGWIQNRQLI